jgi:hypothetical protein
MAANIRTPRAGKPPGDAARAAVRARAPSRQRETIARSRVGCGHGSPQWTIPSSRRDDAPVIPLPGPGAYDVPDDLDAYRRVRPLFPRAVPRGDAASVTSNVDFVFQPAFPRAREFHIGVREDTLLGRASDAPGRQYFPAERDTRLPHKILSRPAPPRAASESRHLGPGTYDPRPALTREPAFYFSGPRNRTDWMADTHGSPGPGAYEPDVKDVLARVPVWTIGRRSRLNREKSAERERPRDLLAMGHIVVDLGALPNPKAARQFAMQHPELRGLVLEMLDIVFTVKCDNPVRYISHLFEQLRSAEPVEDLDD